MDALLPDIMANGLDVVFCGINPGRRAAATGHHFVGRGNRFWRVIHLAGFTPVQISADQDRTLLDHRCGLTTVVERPTARADELSTQEIFLAATRLAGRIEMYRPRFIAFLGKSAYAAISNRRQVDWGPQDSTFGAARTWVLPNPSGRNLSFSLDDLVEAYAQLRRAAGRTPCA